MNLYKIRVMALGLFLGPFLGACGSPRTLAEAIEQRHDDFPKTSHILVPPSNIDRLGETVEVLGGRRARPLGGKCFHVAKVEGAGLERIEVSYEAGAEFEAEMATVAAKAGAKLTSKDTATIVLEGLQVVEGIGVPMRSSPCNFVDGKQVVKVVTSTVVAKTARLEFSRNMKFSGSAATGWAVESEANLGASVNSAKSGALTGSNIVLTASVTPVEVELVQTEHNLGTDPEPDTVLKFPSGFDGNVRILSFSMAHPGLVSRLKLTPNTTMGVSAINVPAGIKVCKPGVMVELKAGALDCYIWDHSGASGVSVWYELKTIEGVKNVVVHLDGYRTTFRPAK